MLSLGFNLSLGVSGGPTGPFAVISGLTGGFAIIGDHATLTVDDGRGGTVTARKWGSTSGGSEYGTGTSPTDYTANVGNPLYATITVDGEDYTRSATIAYAAGTAPAVADGQAWIVDDTAVNLDGAASGANLTFSYAISGVPSDITINSGTGAITGTLDFANSGASGSGTGTITATDQYGRNLQDTFTWSYALRTQATGGADLDLVFPEDVAITATDLTANWTLNGNTLTYAMVTALPAGLSVSSAGSMTGTPTTVTADATYTLRGTDEYGRVTDDTFTLEISDVVLTLVTNGLDQDPPVLVIRSNTDGTAYIDLNSTASAPAPGAGDVGGVTFTLTAGEDSDSIDLSSLGGLTGYFFVQMVGSNVLSLGEYTIPASQGLLLIEGTTDGLLIEGTTDRILTEA